MLHRALTVGLSERLRRPTCSLSMRVPTRERSAGSRVIAATTATATAVAVPHARPVRKLRRTSSSPSSEIMTVTPAKTTERPAVRMASSMASSDARSARERGAMAGDDQQRVVDADADADHRRDLTGEVGCVDERGPEGDGGERHEDARDRGGDRESHRDDRAEREQQDHHRGEETDELGGRQLAVGEDVTAERHLDRGAVGDLLHRQQRCPRGLASAFSSSGVKSTDANAMCPSGEKRAVSSSGESTSATRGSAAMSFTTDRMADSFEDERRSESDRKTTMAVSSP